MQLDLKILPNPLLCRARRPQELRIYAPACPLFINEDPLRICCVVFGGTDVCFIADEDPASFFKIGLL